MEVDIKTYTYEEALEEALDYFDGGEIEASAFLNKYALKTLDGRYVERTPDEMHRRIAKELARMEAKYPNSLSEDEIYEYLKKFEKIIPQGSPMAGIGNPFQVMSLSNCFHEDTEIFTHNRGAIKIKDAEIGDLVTTHTGEVKPIVQLHKNELGDRHFFRLSMYKTPDVRVTGNHRLLSISQEQLEFGEDPSFNSVNYLREGDYVAVPKKEDGPSVSILSVKDIFLSVKDDYTIAREDSETFAAATQYEREGSVITDSVRTEWLIDERFAFFIGLWYGDGCVFSQSRAKKKPKGITFTFGIHEENLKEFVVDYGTSLLGVQPKIHEYDGHVQITFHSLALSTVFEKLFGRGFQYKKLHPMMYDWNREMTQKLLAGLITSDGTVTSDGNVRFVMSNRDFVKNVYHLARSHNIMCGYSESGNVCSIRFPKNHDIVSLVRKTYEDNRIQEAIDGEVSSLHYKTIGDRLFVKITDKQIEYDRPEFVYTLGINDVHSYNVEGVVCENCFVIGNKADSYGGITKMDQELVQLMKRRAGVGIDISHIRPAGSPVQNAARTSTGIVPFMDRFSNSTREVAQGGRRGALMEMVDIRHPDAEGFIDAKMKEGKVTGANVSVKITDEFLEAVQSDDEFIHRWPIEADPVNAEYVKSIKANDLWQKIVNNAWESAEPGLFFWDHVKRESPADCYADFGFETLATNPCFSGDTKIAVADGRNAVSIKQLADEGKDVPVYAVNRDTGDVEIKTGRNPRITGYDKEMVRVWLDDSTYVDVTPNHKFLLRSGEVKKAIDLSSGDSLMRYTKRAEHVSGKNSNQYYRVQTNCRDTSQKIFEHRLIAEFSMPEEWERVYDENKVSGWSRGGLVVHHKDYDGLNNRIDNLEIMTFKDHQRYHADHDNSGKENGRWIDVSNDKLRSMGISLAKKLGRRFSRKEWKTFAKKENLPQHFSSYRAKKLGNVVEFGKWCAKQANVSKFNNVDPRVVQTYNDMLDQGYTVKIHNGRVYVEKFDELTGEPFWIEHRKREISFANQQNALKYLNSNKEFQKNRIESVRNSYKKKAQKTRNDQIEVFIELENKLGRDPLLSEWKNECSNKKISKRLGTKYGFDNYMDLKNQAEIYNHRVDRIEFLEERETVYNITVDDHHTVGIVTGNYENKAGNLNFHGIFTLQCGEIPLCPEDSCRLLAMNLYGFVVNPFTDDAYFDFDGFKEAVRVAQRLMDDIVDLELEQIDKILNKIENDPEPDHIKRTEKELWRRIREKCVQGRRTGLGITAMGDMLASLNYTYGSSNATDFAEKVIQTLKLEAYRSSVDMAEERGHFPIWDHRLEENNPFLLRIKDEDPELYERMNSVGRRNISLLTIAPTGTVSLMARTTSGIENLFMVYYFRSKKVNPDDDGVRVDYYDEVGDAWQEFVIFHPRFETWIEAQGMDVEEVKEWNKADLEQLAKDSPYHNATVSDVDWVKKVEMQGACQRHIDHAISVTVNLPSDITVEKVKEVYETAWKSGCKGITVYRDGSRTGVLNTESKKDQTDGFEDNHAPKRPKELECDVYHFQNDKEKWIAFIGLLDGRPYEIFTGRLEEFQIPASVDRGKIIKVKENGHSRYDFQYVYRKNREVAEGLSKVFDPEYWNYAKLVSGLLRHGMPIQYAVSVLQDLELNDFINTWKAGVIRQLKRYIPDGTEAVEDVQCPNCGDDGHLIYQEGCVICLNCGGSKCG